MIDKSIKHTLTWVESTMQMFTCTSKMMQNVFIVAEAGRELYLSCNLGTSEVCISTDTQ